MAPQKPDIVIMDRESRQKCSIYPLSSRSDMSFMHSDSIVSLSPGHFEGYLFLHVDGPVLGPSDDERPLLLLDASWKRAMKLSSLPALRLLPKRSIEGFSTAYPRASKLYRMPDAGLASIEAFYIARLIQGREDKTLLDHYHWKSEFLEENHALLEKWREYWKERHDCTSCV